MVEVVAQVVLLVSLELVAEAEAMDKMVLATHRL
jgi:hypothetical protein